jgi:hypothetical protein
VRAGPPPFLHTRRTQGARRYSLYSARAATLTALNLRRRGGAALQSVVFTQSGSQYWQLRSPTMPWNNCT